MSIRTNIKNSINQRKRTLLISRRVPIEMTKNLIISNKKTNIKINNMMKNINKNPTNISKRILIKIKLPKLNMMITVWRQPKNRITKKLKEIRLMTALEKLKAKEKEDTTIDLISAKRSLTSVTMVEKGGYMNKARM